ncbi:hypothetical protein AX15_000309 [Amanita polypyramis BW_CC]|nr:hypothetical protein AX15_000309 [Amanita polypyramis BW_CC]
MTSLLYFFIALFSLALACLAQLVSLSESSSLQTLSEFPAEYRFLPPHTPAASDKPTDHDLLDIVLVSSVDGKLHALNRTSGHTLWSMSSFTSPILSNASMPPPLVPLVRTNHVEYDPDLTDESDIQETYIIEPQSGAIFVMTNPSSPLKRFPYTMSELVDMSPYFFLGDEGTKMFVGRKETSLLLVELETGKIKATINTECPWVPSGDMEDDNDVDLDELEGSKASPSEVFIGRTDYHISIHTMPRSRSPSRPPTQNLSFSVYGPNNQDQFLQVSYRRTKDDAYIQSLPTGEILSFTAKPKGTVDSHLLWMRKFSNPIVAVFDVLKRSSSISHPFVLEQPRPRLQDVVPNFSSENAAAVLPNVDSAHVGMVAETGSLFAMSQDRFPLVAFGNNDGDNRGRLIEASRPSQSMLLDDTIPLGKPPKLGGLNCRSDVISDKRCLLGMKRIEEGEWPLKRLLEAGHSSHGVPRVDAPIPVASGIIRDEVRRNSGGGIADDRTVPGSIGTDDDILARQSSTWQMVIAIVTVGVVSAWMTWKRLETTMTKGITTLSALNSTIEPNAKEEVPSLKGIPPTHNGREAITPRNSTSASPLSTSSSRAHTGANIEPQAASPSPEGDEGDDSDRDVEADGDLPPTPGRKKVRRGKRGKKKKVGIVAPSADEGKKSNQSPETESATLSPVSPGIQVGTSLIVSDTVLGYGSHGTVVFQGSLQGRAVAVKRLLRDFVTLASREVSILQESDDHPNVIRYYYQESHANFFYIALELCPASLADIVENPDREQWKDIAISFEPKRALKQITSGLKHLHALKLVHRDIKPQNILVSSSKPGEGSKGGYRMLISDFGLCKKLEVDQTSFAPTAYGAMAAGTVGWRAPEILRGEVKLDEVGDDNSMSSRGSVATVVSASGSLPGNLASAKPRLTKSVDIFALGCLFYYSLTNGGHPFGDKYEREMNILKNSKNLNGLERFGEEGSEAVDLITRMLDPDASRRPDTMTCLLHPFFWDPGRRLNFLQDASDRFEIMCRDPKDPYLVELEKDAASIVGNDWHTRLDRIFIENLGKFRKYDGKSVQDLLRALRNKKHHYQDIPDNVRRHLGPMPDGYLAYFTRRFPGLFLHVHNVIRTTGLRTESMFRSYFELPD